MGAEQERNFIRMVLEGAIRGVPSIHPRVSLAKWLEVLGLA